MTEDVRLRADEETVRALCLARAVEEVDRTGRILSLEERRKASDRIDGPPEDWLPERSRRLAERLDDLRPEIGAGPRRIGPAGASWILGAALVGLSSGLGTEALGAGRDVHVLAPPLLALLAWNLAVVVGGLAFRLIAPRRPGLPEAWLRRRQAVRERGGGEEDPVRKARLRFLRFWGRAALPLGTARVRRALHVGALCVVTGVVGGMYLRGLVLQYRVSWESTFLTAPTVDRIAETILGPAAAVLGREIPGTSGLELPDSGPAGPWIHLWATTAALFVGVPRALLLVESALRVRRLEISAPVEVPGGWIDRIRSIARSTALRVVVRPYSFDPTEKAWTTLRHLVLDLAGPRAEISRETSLAYGDPAPPTDGDLEIVVFPLAQTPEAEVHGELLRTLGEGLGGGAGLLVVVDSSSFRRRIAGATDGERRLEERRRAWTRVVTEAGFSPVAVDLEAADLEDLEARARPAIRPEGMLG